MTTSKAQNLELSRENRLDLIRRMLGLRHKLKVHDSMKMPETHEEVAVMTLSRWEVEDEIKAIEELLEGTRLTVMQEKRTQIKRDLSSGKTISAKKTAKTR